MFFLSHLKYVFFLPYRYNQLLHYFMKSSLFAILFSVQWSNTWFPWLILKLNIDEGKSFSAKICLLRNIVDFKISILQIHTHAHTTYIHNHRESYKYRNVELVVRIKNKDNNKKNNPESQEGSDLYFLVVFRNVRSLILYLFVLRNIILQCDIPQNIYRS